MKKLLLFLIYLPQLLWAQVDFNYVSPLEYARYYAMDVDSAKNVVVVGSSISCADALIDFFDGQGNLKWRLSDDRFSINLIADVLIDSDGHIVVVGVENQSDDVGSPEDGFFLLKLTLLGDTLFYAKHPTGNFPIAHQAFILTQQDSSYLASLNDHLYWLGNNGELIRQQQISINRIKGLDSAPSGHFMVHNKEEAQLFNWAGTLINSYKGIGLFIDISYAKDTTWLLLEDQLWAIHTLDQAPKIDTLPSSFQLAKIAARKNGAGVALYTKEGNEHSFFNYKNSHWEPLSIRPTLGANVNDFIAIDSSYYFTGIDLWHNPEERKPLYGAYLSATNSNVNYPNEINYDISLESIIVEPLGSNDTSDYIRGYPDRLDTIAYKISRGFNGTVTVKNTGSVDLNNFVLSSEWIGGFNCGQRYDYHYLDNLNLKPGKTHSFSIPIYHYYYNRIGVPSENQNRCFYVSAPNSQFDEQIE